MTKPINVSFSKLSTYETCPKKYEIEYVQYLTPDKLSTPLFFGSAIDIASELIFLSKHVDEKLRKKHSKEEIEAVFLQNVTTVKWQNEDLHIPTSDKVSYSKADMQPELLTEEDLKEFAEFQKDSPLEVEDVDQFMEYCKDTKNITSDERYLYNFLVWKSMCHKGLMMLETLSEWFEENVESVYHIQRRIKIDNEDGDVLRGMLDLEVKMKDGTDRVLDLKTASNAVAQYPDDCINDAMQLHIYDQESDMEKVGYVVLDKSIRKKNPRVRIREVYGEVTDEMQDKTFDKIDNILTKIKNKEFDKNFDACYTYGKCPYYDYCRNGSKKGIVKRVYNK